MFVEKNNLRESSALASSLALVSSNDSNPQLAILYQHADGNLKKRGLMVEAWIILTLVSKIRQHSGLNSLTISSILRTSNLRFLPL